MFPSVQPSESVGDSVDRQHEQSSDFSGELSDPNDVCDSTVSSNTQNQPECIKAWCLEFEERIRLKDEAESAKLTVMEEQGLKDLHDWANQYRESLSRAIKSSRAHDKDLRLEQNAAATASATLCDADASQPALWERVCHLCSFVAAAADDTGSGAIPVKELCTKDSSKDLHRMRTLLLQLKQNPPTLRRVG
ncbi:hypothetical protein EG68_10811 [Paragonimus skrjabini miyazakii]|uniref:Clathrin light chain n=1 Tax=Paragonimus skrjabini miyazakii TaxID=59628 RepID=A0A8S9YIP0_9TREM|nr:hypothetical protein EG68_10811 [Paragonimus skrjabini miyazakii]